MPRTWRPAASQARDDSVASSSPKPLSARPCRFVSARSVQQAQGEHGPQSACYVCSRVRVREHCVLLETIQVLCTRQVRMIQSID